MYLWKMGRTTGTSQTKTKVASLLTAENWPQNTLWLESVQFICSTYYPDRKAQNLFILLSSMNWPGQEWSEEQLQ